MLFRLSDTLLSYSSRQQRKVFIGVTNLLVGYYEGKNLLIISDAFYNHFSKVLSDDRALLALRHLYSYTVYDYNVSKSFTVKLDGSCGKDELLIDYFINTTSIQPVYIIGENTNDVKFYAIVTRIIRHVKSDNLSYKSVLGGGYTTAGRLEECQNNEQIALCIVDSDIKYPNAQEGPTYGEILSKYDPNNKYVCLIGIKVHEIENLLPPKFIQQNTRKNNDAQKIINRIISTGHINYLRWYDIKSGISIGDIQNKDYDEFAKEMYGVLYNAKPGTYKTHVLDCMRKKIKVFPSICDGLVKKFLNLSFDKQLSYSIYFKEEWREIADNFYSFACSREDSPISI